MHRIRVAGLAGLLTIVVAACSSQPSSTPATSTTPIPSEPPASSAPAAPSATESASSEASASVPALPSGLLGGLDFHGAPDLEAVLPDTVDGTQVVKMSFSGDQLQQLGSAMGQTQFSDVMQQAGIDPSDVSVALGTVGAGDAGAQVSAFKAAGADAAQLREGLEAAAAEGATEKVTWASETVGGKSVTTATVNTPESPGPTKVYVYVMGDTIFQVVSTDPDIAGALLTALP